MDLCLVDHLDVNEITTSTTTTTIPCMVWPAWANIDFPGVMVTGGGVIARA